MKKYLLVFISVFYFLVGFSQTIDITSISNVDNDTLCNKGSYALINYQANGTFNSGNLFYIEVSDMNGSFANAIALGYSSSATSSSLILPELNGFPVGTGYRFRIVSSNPVVYGNDNGSDYVLFYPDVNVTSASGQLEATTTVPSSSFQWFNCNGLSIPGETSSILSAGVVGNEYSVEVSQLGCVDTSACAQFIGFNSIVEEGESAPFKYSPNPVTEDLSIELDKMEASARVHVYNPVGQLISVSKYINVQEILLDIEGAGGIYLIEVGLEEGNFYRFRVVKN